MYLVTGKHGRCRPWGEGKLCRHRWPTWCHAVHHEDDQRLGTRTCGDCYDYPGHGAFNWYAPELWRERTPLPSLARRVRPVWMQHTGPGSYVQRNLPTGGAELQCRIGSVPRLVGPLAAAKIEVLPAESTIVGVRFWAGAAAALLGVLPDELVDLAVPLDDLWGATRRAPRLRCLVLGRGVGADMITRLPTSLSRRSPRIHAGECRTVWVLCRA